jgi:hypothetical protein
MGRGVQQHEDIGRAKDSAESVQQQLDAMNADLESQIAELDTSYDPQTEKLDVVTVKPKRTGINVQLVALVWVPA